jgi:hypothetical protein
MNEYKLTLTIEEFGDEEKDYREYVSMYKQKLPKNVIAGILRQMADELDPRPVPVPQYHYLRTPVYGGLTSTNPVTYESTWKDEEMGG